ncbi:tyrosine-type recombinase/integrase [Actinocrispum wychmicini]|uniref:Site-specific recombinase XerD n=1 Tax=Actinocrispum wychmicini TaxID=1213861 RepID=A0A4R2IMC6_9PSEU|nr:tyrosine-type recombinase/integrase [Actinocrispum wychmicini]TCO45867.1 site-specific recombinase XerD [Actinocrispum wychmicini]
MTVGQWLDLWLETRQALAASTRRLYAQHVRDYLKPYLGGVPLRDLTVGKAQAMFTSLMRVSTARGRPLSAATLQRIRGVLRAALNGAIRRGLIERNPARWVELPSGRRPKAVVWTEPRVAQWQATGERPPVAVWTVAQTAAFLENIRGHGLYPLYLLVTLLGLRRGEVAGLRWCDIDLEARVLMVSHQIQDHNGKTVICPPKTRSSVRAIALDHGLVTVLRRMRDAQQRRRLAEEPPTGFLFVNKRGDPLSPGYFTHSFRRLAAQAGLPPIRLHDLRHGAASLSLAAGNALKTVQNMLGHDSIVLTADTYTSVLPCLDHKAAEATADLVLRAAQRTARKLRRRPRQGRRRSRAGVTPTITQPRRTVKVA